MDELAAETRQDREKPFPVPNVSFTLHDHSVNRTCFQDESLDFTHSQSILFL